MIIEESVAPIAVSECYDGPEMMNWIIYIISSQRSFNIFGFWFCFQIISGVQTTAGGAEKRKHFGQIKLLIFGAQQKIPS